MFIAVNVKNVIKYFTSFTEIDYATQNCFAEKAKDDESGGKTIESKRLSKAIRPASWPRRKQEKVHERGAAHQQGCLNGPYDGTKQQEDPFDGTHQ